MDGRNYGTLVFYRWPPGTANVNAPRVCQTVMQRSSSKFTWACIWKGYRGDKQIPDWAAETRTALLLVAVQEASDEEISKLRSLFRNGPVQCRFKSHVASSVVQWIQGQEYVNIPTTVPAEIPELSHFIAGRHMQILDALDECVTLYKSATKRQGVKRERSIGERGVQHDEDSIKRAKAAVRPFVDKPSASSSAAAEDARGAPHEVHMPRGPSH